MNVAIITARAGSKSIPDKNVYPVGGHPLIYYPIKAVRDARLVHHPVYVSTDGREIMRVVRALGCLFIKRPHELCGDDVNHGDVIKHAVEHVDAATNGELENVVLLLGNTVMVDGYLIDMALNMLDLNPDLDSCMSVWRAADDHPLRAMELTHDGLLRPYGGEERDVSTARQSYPAAYYYDQGVWVFRKAGVQSRDGPNPWWWMGERCAPIVREWSAGRDIHTLFDIEIAEWWLGRRGQ